jgi:hypothetical protein
VKTYGGVGVYIHVFLTSALVGGEWSALRPGEIAPPRYPLDRRLRGPHTRSGLRGEEKNLAPIGTRTPTPSAVQPVLNKTISRVSFVRTLTKILLAASDLENLCDHAIAAGV